MAETCPSDSTSAVEAVQVRAAAAIAAATIAAEAAGAAASEGSSDTSALATPRGLKLQAVLLHDAGRTLFLFLGARELGALGVASTKEGEEALADDFIWRAACEQLWADKQKSIVMRQWLAQLAEERARLSGAGCRPLEVPWLETQPAGGCPTWQQRYIFSLRDRGRRRIRREELCQDAALDSVSGQQERRHWHLRLRLDRWQDKEVVFHPRGGDWYSFSFHAFQNSLFEELPWRPSYSGDEDYEERSLVAADSDGEEEAESSMLDAGSFPFVRVPSLPFLLEVRRTPDWGWSLVPREGQNMVLTSRQLSTQEHLEARLVSPELFTLYLRACDTECRHRGIVGSWEVVEGFQGTMPARTWIGTLVQFSFQDDVDGQRGTCNMTFRSDDLTFDLPNFLIFYCAEDPSHHSEGQMDAYTGYNRAMPLWSMSWQRGPVPEDGAVPPLALVMDSTFFYHRRRVGGGRTAWPARPTGIAQGLPLLETVVSPVSLQDLAAAEAEAEDAMAGSDEASDAAE